jgi:hypothetical protein
MCFGLETNFLSGKEAFISLFEKFDHIVRGKFIP